MTKQEIEARQLIGTWLEKNKIKLISKMRHVHPRAYVVGYAAARCLIVAVPWLDSEPQCADEDKKHPLTTIHTFDEKLKPGDWCATAYVCTSGVQEPVAVGWAK